MKAFAPQNVKTLLTHFSFHGCLEAPFPPFALQPALCAEGFKVSVIFLNIPSGDEGKEKSTRE